MLFSNLLIRVSLPTFVIGILFIYFLLSYWCLTIFWKGEVVDIGLVHGFLISQTKAIILPSVTLSLFQMTYIIRLVRAEMMEMLKLIILNSLKQEV